MSCGYACINCGKCKGEIRKPMAAGYCPFCKHLNDSYATICDRCGMRVPIRPGIRMSDMDNAKACDETGEENHGLRDREHHREA